MTESFSIDVEGETLRLLPERAFFWPARKILGLSDIHLGKAQSMQKLGIPVSDEAHTEDLAGIAKLIHRWKPDQVVILGDFIHQRDSWSLSLMTKLSAFFEEFQNARWSLIIGNHDRGSRKFLEQLPFEIFEKHIEIGPFFLTHGHEENENRFTIEGHVHPVIRIADGPIKLRLPCFVLSEKRMLIPSFGSLTGGFEIERKKNDRIFAMTPESVFEVTEPKTKGRQHATRTLER